MMQIGQTEPKGYPKMYIGTSRGEVCSKHKAIIKKEIRACTNFFLDFHLTLAFYATKRYFFFCLVWCAHFATPGSF